MIVRLKKQEHDYVIICRHCAQDSTLSWKARGLLFYLLSQQEDFHVKVAELVKMAPDGRDSVYSAINELKEAGYVETVERRDGGGRVTGIEYIVSEVRKQDKVAFENNSKEGEGGKKCTQATHTAKEVIEYLNDKAGRNFVSEGKKGDANLKIVKARMKDGASVEDCKAVIDQKVSQWTGTDMEQYLRPSTLFRQSKFWEYLEEAKRQQMEVHAKKEDVKLDMQKRQLYQNSEIKFQKEYPRLYRAFGFLKHSEFLDFYSERPALFPTLRTHFSRSYLKDTLRRILKEVENDRNEWEAVKQAGGLYGYIMRRLIETSTL